MALNEPRAVLFDGDRGCWEPQLLAAVSREDATVALVTRRPDIIAV